MTEHRPPEQPSPQNFPYDDWVNQYAQNPEVDGAPQSVRIATYGMLEKFSIFQSLCVEQQVSLTEGVRRAVSLLHLVEENQLVPRMKNDELVSIVRPQTDDISQQESLLDNPKVRTLSVNIGPQIAMVLYKYTEKYGVTLDQAVEHALDVHYQFFTAEPTD